MPSYKDLVATIFDETRACQDPSSLEAQSRRRSRDAPFGPGIPGDGGSYPTTDTAMEALAELADRVRANDDKLKLAINRDQMRRLASQVFGEFLNELTHEPDRDQHWPMIRTQLLARAGSTGRNIVHYVPIWAFCGQNCEPFSIGPVRFIERKHWLDIITARRGQESSWMRGVRTLWAGGRLKGGSWLAGAKASVKTFRKEPFRPSAWRRAFDEALRFSEPKSVSDARTVARLVHPDQWIACAEVDGFECEESRRRGLLAARVALDTIRLILVGPSRKLISTVADSVLPLSVDRLSQVAGADIAHGCHFNQTGVSGRQGLAQVLVNQSRALFDAAGACIAAAVSIIPVHPCPKLADRWFNAAHWFGRACLADVDFVAVVMLVIALDVLCGGLQEVGILELVARLTGTPMSATVLPDGTTLRKLIERTYKLRSEVAHGSVLAVHQALDIERAHLEDLAAAALAKYVVQLESYGSASGADDRDTFRNALPPAQP